jgi:tetratricopeptide (TPR) repeat protein
MFTYPPKKNLLTKENLQYIARATEKSTDPGFKIVQQYSKEFDAVNGIGRSRGIIVNVAYDEVVLPMVRINGAKVTNGAGMYHYTGDLNKNVNWADVKAKLDAKYSQMADEIVAKSKVRYAMDLDNWPKFVEAVNAYVAKYGDVEHTSQMNTYANEIFLFSDDKKCIEQALGWSKQSIAVSGPEEKDWYLTTYINLLYKLGNKNEALAMTDDAIKRLGNKADRFKEIKDKMSKNEKTW